MPGPFNRTDSYSATAVRNSTWWTQSKPYRSPLAYNVNDVRRISGSYYDARYTPAAPDLFTQNDRDAVALKAYEKIVEQLGEKGQWANNVIERQKSADMISRRATQLYKAMQDIRQGRMDRAAGRFGLTHPPRSVQTQGVRQAAHAFGRNFLEFHFGWEPLVKDIGRAIETLQGPCNTVAVRGRGSRTISKVNEQPKPLWYREINNGTIRCQMSASVEVTNPDLFLANQLGFINPAGIAWEAVPFSFVADWFGTVGSFLASMTDFVGTKLTYQCTTYTYASYSSCSGYHPGYSGVKQAFAMRRSLGIAHPGVFVRPWKNVSATRAATAIALVGTLFGVRSTSTRR